jgi:hypothetical protein
MHSLCKYNPNGEGLISDKKEFQLGKKITEKGGSRKYRN